MAGPDLISSRESAYDCTHGIFEIQAPMKRVSTVAAIFGSIALGGWASGPDVDQIAQSRMIGLSGREIRACMGEPVRRRSIGATTIWSFADGMVRIEGEGIATFGYRRHTACNVKIVLTKGRVSQVEYTGPDGDPLDLGERCDFDVQRCVGP
jgi:hypothetical protein